MEHTCTSYSQYYPLGQFESLQLTQICIFLDFGRNLEYLEKPCTDTGRTCKLNRMVFSQRIKIHIVWGHDANCPSTFISNQKQRRSVLWLSVLHCVVFKRYNVCCERELEGNFIQVTWKCCMSSSRLSDGGVETGSRFDESHSDVLTLLQVITHTTQP